MKILSLAARGLAGLAIMCVGTPVVNAQPNLTPPVILPGDDVVGAAAGDQEEPAIAFGNSQYLVAWTDWRADRTGTLLLDQSGSDIYAARVAADGTLIDTLPIAVHLDAEAQSEPQVAWNGSSWLVTWMSVEPTQFFYAASVLGARISPQGQLLDATPIEILKYSFSSSVTHVTIGAGSDWLVIGQGTSAGESDVVGRRIGANGNLLDPSPKTLLSPSSLVFHPSLAFSNGTYLFAWWGSSGVRARRFDAALNQQGPEILISGSTSGINSIGAAGNANRFFVTFGRYQSSNQFGWIYGARVTTTGTVVDPGGFTIATGSLLSQPDAGVSWDGSNWLVSWKPSSFQSNLGLLVSRISSSGQNLDPGGVSVKPNPNAEFDQPEIVGKPNGGAQVVWTDRRAGGPFPEDIYTVAISPALQPGSEHLISMGAPRQTGADVIWNGQEYVIAYKSEISGAQRILVQRVDASGQAIDVQPIEVAPPSSALLGAPHIDWNGNVYCVAYGEDSSARMVRLDASLNKLDATPVAVMPISNLGVDVAALGPDFLIVGVNNPTQEHTQSVYGKRVASNGQFLDATPVLYGPSFALFPRVVAFGGNWLVCYRRNNSHDNSFARVYAAFVSPGGLPQPVFTVHTPATSGLSGVDVVASPTEALVCWSDPVNDGDIVAKRLTTTGALLDGPNGISVVTASDAQFAPAVGFDGTDFMVVHEDLRHVTFFRDLRSNVFGARVSATGQSLDPVGFPIHDDVTPDIEPAVAGAAGNSLTVAATFQDSAPYASYRLTLRVVDACSGNATSFGPGCAGSGGFVPTLQWLGCPSPGESGSLSLSNALGGGTALLLFGAAPSALPMGGGCQLLGFPLLPFSIPLPLSAGGPGTGQTTLPFVIPPTAPALSFVIQGFVPDSGVPVGFSSTQGLDVSLQ